MASYEPSSAISRTERTCMEENIQTNIKYSVIVADRDCDRDQQAG